LVELVRLDPGDWLTHDLYSIVDSLDREEALRKALTHSAVKHEIAVKILALLNFRLGNLEGQVLWKLRIKRDEAESVVEIAERIHERRVAVLDYGRQTVLGRLLDVSFSYFDLPSAQVFLVFF
jgi:hypothetical protein